MDILSGILNSTGLKRSVLARHTFYQDWAMQFPCDQSMGFHVITQGEVYIRSTKLKSPLLLKKGDIILLTRGFDHVVTTDPKLKVGSTAFIDEASEEIPGEKPIVTLASGIYQFQTDRLHPILNELPEQILFRAEEIPAHDPLHSALQLLSVELSQKQIGSDAITRNLLDILFHYILRHWVHSEGSQASSWAKALKDPFLVKALKAIHDSPQTDWGVDELASVTGLSRAAFAQKFKKMTGDTPAHYLAKIRIQRAIELFKQSSKSIEEVAESVGYKDSFVFSKAFKRIQGVAPRDYRKSVAS